MSDNKLTPREEFKQIRLALNLKQTECALTLGVHQYTISRWESGKRPIPLIALKFMRLLSTKSVDNVVHSSSMPPCYRQ